MAGKSKKLGIKKLQINLTNRWLYTLIVFFSLVVIGVFVYAVAPNPGHDITQIAQPSECSTNQFLKWTGSSWTCETVSDEVGIGGSGTANYVPKFTAATTVGNSIIYESAGNIDIVGNVYADAFIGDGRGLTNIMVRAQGDTCNSANDGLFRYRSSYCVDQSTVVSDFSICMRKADSSYSWDTIKSYSWSDTCTCPSGTTYFECTGDYVAPGCYASRPANCFRTETDPPERER